MNTDLSVVGKRLPAYGVAKKATGAAKYSVDVLPGHARGQAAPQPPRPRPHPLHRQVPAPRRFPASAQSSAGRTSPEALQPQRPGLDLHDATNEINDMYVISEKARFVGDIVAAVAAVDEATRDKALELIEVDYEVLPAVFDLFEAMKPGAPLVHDFAENNVSRSFAFAGSRGDVEGALRDAAVIVEATFKTSKQYIMALEPLSCLAEFAPTGELTVWMPVQRPLTFRKKIAELFELPESKVNVICEYAGGFFGEANWSVLPICVALAKRAGRAVKLEYSRPETAMNTASRETYVITGTLGVDAEGRLTAVKEEVIVDSGAYFNRSAACTIVHMSDFTGLYRCPNVFAQATAVYSNVPMASGFRGYGGPPAFFALEQLMDMAAEKLGLDPVEFRLRNVKRMGDFGHAFPLETDTHAAGHQARGRKDRLGREARSPQGGRRSAPGRGRGCLLRCERRPTVRALRPQRRDAAQRGRLGHGHLQSPGRRHEPARHRCRNWPPKCSAIGYEDVRFVHGETEGKLWDGGMAGNGGLYTVGNAVVNAARSLKEKILAEGGSRLGIPATELEREEWRNPSEGRSRGRARR